MNTIARRIAATATLTAAPALIALGIAAGANAAPGAVTGADATVAPGHTISAPATAGEGRTRPAQSWNARHRYNHGR